MPKQFVTNGTVTPHRPDRAPRGWPRVLGVMVAVALLNVLLIGVTGALAEDGPPAGTGGDGLVELQIYNGDPATNADLPSVVYLEAGDGACTGTVIAAGGC